MRVILSNAWAFLLLASLIHATYLIMAEDAGCMNVAPENIHGWKGDLDPYANFQHNNNTRVPYTSVCSRLDGSTTETLNNRLDTGDRGQATISAVWTVVAPDPSFDCAGDVTQCPYLSPGCKMNATWDAASNGVLYVMNSTDAGTVTASSKCLYYQNQSTIVTTNGQQQCCDYDATAPTLPPQVNPYYIGWGNQQGLVSWPLGGVGIPVWWQQSTTSSTTWIGSGPG